MDINNSIYLKGLLGEIEEKIHVKNLERLLAFSAGVNCFQGMTDSTQGRIAREWKLFRHYTSGSHFTKISVKYIVHIHYFLKQNILIITYPFPGNSGSSHQQGFYATEPDTVRGTWSVRVYASAWKWLWSSGHTSWTSSSCCHASDH